MPDTTTTLLPGDQGQHYELITQAIASCLVNSSAERRQALKQTPVHTLPSWHDVASQAQKDQLSALLETRCNSQIELEKSFGKVQAVEMFSEPLLVAALKTLGHELDVHQTYLRLYVPVEDAFGVRTGGFKVKTFSLLRAALGNFEAREAEVDFFDSTSGFITAPDERGHFERHTTALKIHEFAQLCRDLDLGAQYQAHLQTLLETDERVTPSVFRERYLSHQKDAFKAAAYMALLKGDIGASDYALLMRVAAGEQRIMIGEQQVWYRSVCLMNLPLHDCVIIDPCVEYRYSDWFIVYIPEDPDHPIKRYETFNDFRNNLTDRLTAKASQKADRSNAWQATPNQHFFGQFVADEDRPYYYRRLTELVVDAPPQPLGSQWLHSEWGRLLSDLFAPPFSSITSTLGEPQPSVRVPITAPEFNINADAINGLWVHVDLWAHRYTSLCQRLSDDARNQAVSTADADEASHSRRMAHYLSIGMFGLNLAAMAIPPLGAVMAVVMAGQLLYEVMEGAIELSEGDREAGWAHITDVVENLAALAAGAAAFHFTVSPFIEELKAVTLPSGKTRLWKPDLSPYEHPQPIPSGVAADERGLYPVNGKTVLPLNGKRYVVQQDPFTEQYRIVHPTRPDAYQPALTENGSGLWRHALERPHTWEGAPLMRRLGPMTEGFSDVELEQVRQAADVSEDVLRRVHVEGEPIPAILLDTLRQFRAYRDAVRVAEGIRQGSLSSELCSYAASLMVELPRWPASVAIEAFSGVEANGPSIKYGNSQAAAADTLRIHRGDLMNGQLPKRVVESLSDLQLDDLLGRYTPRTPEARTAALQALLEQHAISVRSRLMNSIYVEQQPASDPAIRLVQRDFSRLPTHLVRELLEDATLAEREMMSSAQQLPFRLAKKARLAQQQMRLTLAYEGLHLEPTAGPDTEALALNSLANVPGWSDGLRLEVREGYMEGELRASVGEVDAAERKVLVRVAEGQYQAFDALGQSLHGVNGLYGSLQHALPDAHRNAIGLPHVGQGAQLKALLIDNVLSRTQLRSVLGIQPEKLPFSRPVSVLPDGRRAYALAGRGGSVLDQRIQERILTLYPDLPPEEVTALRQERGWFDNEWLESLERERNVFKTTMNRWISTHTEGVEPFGEVDRNALKAKRFIYETLHEALKRTGPRHYDARGQYVGQKIEWVAENLREQLRTLPDLRTNFDQVTQLILTSSNATDADVGRLLGNFRGLRSLSLESGELTELPQAIGNMPHLRSLNLGSNMIALQPAEVVLLSRAKRLEALSLSNNPLERAPDVSGMTKLRTLWLSNTGLEEWPAGVFRVPRPRDFRLDLQSNSINRVPVFAPGSDNALIVARTLLSREKLTPELLKQFKQYIEAAGNDPERQFPVRGEYDRRLWNTGVPPEELHSRQRLWDHLEQSFGSEAFFTELRLIRKSGDATVDSGRLLPELTEKVWRMLEAMGEDAELRDELFLMARQPSACVDAGAQLFNAMGVQVLLRAAYFSEDASVVRKSVFNLARGKWRLDELGRIAHNRVEQLKAQGVKYPEYDDDGNLVFQYDDQGNEIQPIDEVEIYLSYTAPLATRLDLPWQAKSMAFAEEYVTEQMVEEAFKRVTALEQGELLRGNLLEQPIWVDYLRSAHLQELSPVRNKFEALIDLETALVKWLRTDSSLTQELDELRATISRTSALLGRTGPGSQPGYVITPQEYSTLFASLEAEYLGLLGDLTDQAISSLLPGN